MAVSVGDVLSDAPIDEHRIWRRGTEPLNEEDARMWRHMKFRHRPIYAKQDIAGYRAMRKWCEQFYALAFLSPAMAERTGDKRD